MDKFDIFVYCLVVFYSLVETWCIKFFIDYIRDALEERKERKKEEKEDE